MDHFPRRYIPNIGLHLENKMAIINYKGIFYSIKQLILNSRHFFVGIQNIAYICLIQRQKDYECQKKKYCLI